MKTKSIYSEIIYSLSPSTNVSQSQTMYETSYLFCVYCGFHSIYSTAKVFLYIPHISESFKNFGIRDDSTSVVVVVLSTQRDDGKVS